MLDIRVALYLVMAERLSCVRVLYVALSLPLSISYDQLYDRARLYNDPFVIVISTLARGSSYSFDYSI
jgi:hypothetical protein